MTAPSGDLLFVPIPLIAALSAACVPRGGVERGAQAVALHRRLAEVHTVGADPDRLHALLGDVYVGEALTQAYLSHHRTQRRLAEDGVEVVVESVDYEVSEDLGPDGAGAWVRLEWAVTGRVDHDGHQHLRRNQYAARLHLRPTEDGWRIDEEQLLSARRVRHVSSTGPGRPLRELLDELD